MHEITKPRLKSLEAAEAVAQQVRLSIVTIGYVGAEVYPFLEQWMRRTGNVKYEKPKTPAKTWCGSCKKRHIAGNCEPSRGMEVKHEQ